jgi:uncharacterized protein (UPF0333 family)
MKGQASIELLITLGVVLAFTIPVLFLLFSITSVGYENAGLAQAEASSRSLADSINMVYSQGPDAKRVVLLNLPARTRELRIEGGEVIITVATSSGDFQAVSPTFANIEETTVVDEEDPRSGLVHIQVLGEESTDDEVFVRVSLVEG